MIDWTHISELKADMGDAFDEVVALFLEEAGGAVDRLDPAASAGNMGGDLHFLKGAALNLGFTDFAALCAAGERAANEGHPERVDIAAVVACYHASVAQFTDGLPRLA